MKINNKDLKNLYKAYLMENSSLFRKNCPSTKNIINLFRSKLSEKQISKLIDHITNCYHCSQEFEFILQTLRQEKRLRNEIKDMLLSKKEDASIKQRTKKKNADLLKKLISFYPRLSWKSVPLLLGVILAILLSSVLIVFHDQEKEGLRSTEYIQLKLIEPVKGKHQKSLLVFRWEETKSVDYFILELFDESLRPIWKSKKIFNNHIVLPKQFIDALSGNKMYFWMVTAYFSDRKKVESRIENFILIN